MKFAAYILAILLVTTACNRTKSPAKQRLNILLAIADDQSFPHTSAYGTKTFLTPAFDKVASSGVLFMNAFVTAPQCSPSRASLLTGRPIWQLEEAGTHSSFFPKKFPVFTDALESAGYFVGYTGKGWGPGNWKDAGWTRNPVGIEYNDNQWPQVPDDGISKTNYARNFEAFLDDRPADSPFFFWFGSHEPHRDYEFGAGMRAGLDSSNLEVPQFLPKTDSVITDMLDYGREIEWFDQQLNAIINILEKKGELANTVIVVTADNGMPFPHAKASLHEYGIHIPLAIGGAVVNKPGRRVEDMVTFLDLAPTFLELAGVPLLENRVGKSLLPLLQSDQSGIIDSTRSYILAGRERHTHARPDNLGYPARALRTQHYLYIQNMKPDRWPMGDPAPLTQVSVDNADMKPIVHGYEDIDDSPTKEYMLKHRNEWPELFNAAFAKRGGEELYDITTDPYCLYDLSDYPSYKPVLEKLREQLETDLRAQDDPRMNKGNEVFDSYPRFGRMRPFSGFRERATYNPAFVPETGKEK